VSHAAMAEQYVARVASQQLYRFKGQRKIYLLISICLTQAAGVARHHLMS